MKRSVIERPPCDQQVTSCFAFEFINKATIKPYNPRTSAKIKIKIMPTNKRGCWALPLTPASPTMPIAKPAAKPDKPTDKPAPNWMKPVYKAWRCSNESETRTETTKP